MPPAPLPLVWTLWLARLLGLGVASLLLAEAAARIGQGALRLRPPRFRSACTRVGLGFLLAVPLLGLTNLGLGLAGLLRPGPLAGAAVLLFLLSGALRQRSLLLRAAAAEVRALGAAGLAALGLAAAAIAYYLLTPEFDQDSLVYHLGAPAQFLVAGRVLLDHLPFVFHLPLTVEMAYALPLAFGEERLPRCLEFATLAALGSVWIGHALEAGEPEAGWLGPLLVCTSPMVMWLASTSKNDMAAASLFAAGALLCLRGARVAGWVYLGLALAAKFVYAPLVVLWAVAFRPGWRRLPWAGAGLLLPSAAWWAKSWLATGNPVYPFASGAFPSLDWGAANRASFLVSQRGIWEANTLRWPDVPLAVLHDVWQDYRLLLPGLALLLVFGPARRVAVLLGAGLAAALGLGHLSRYMLPAALVGYLLAGRLPRLLPASLRRVATGALALVALGVIGASPFARRDQWRDALTAWGPTLAARDTTFAELADDLRRLGVTSAVLDGQTRTFRFPARFIAAGAVGETPLLWRLATEARDPAELRRRYRQLGDPWLIHNFVGCSWMDMTFAPFAWNDRALALHLEFCRRYLEVGLPARRSDYQNGGFTGYRLRREPLSRPPATIWFAPGTEALYAVSTAATVDRQPADALAACRAVIPRLPGVLHALNQCGHYEMELERYDAALADLTPGIRAGMMDFLNVPEYGMAALMLKQPDVAVPVLEDALTRYPDLAGRILLALAQVHLQRAYAAYGARDPGTAAFEINETFSRMNRMGPAAERAQGAAARRVRAMAHGLLGEFRLLNRDQEGARQAFREALALASDLPQARRWEAALAGHP